MNKLELFEDQRNNANSSNSNNNKQQSSKLQRQTSVIPTFFRWFKRPNHLKHQQFHSGRSAIETKFHRYENSSRESLNFNASENYSDNILSPSISCDSVLSTSTTGFAFIKPNKYGNLVEPKILSDHQTDNNSIGCINKNSNTFNLSNTEIEAKPKLTLKQKYFLFESDTLKSTASAGESTHHLSSYEAYGDYDNISSITSERNSIQNHQKNYFGKDKGHSEEPVLPTRRHRSRRTASDSSKELHSGAYVHVKGKRKAPHPPLNTNSDIVFPQNSNSYENSNAEPIADIYRTLSPVSTIGRKKRKAPPPPLLTDLHSNKLNFENQYAKSPSISRKLPSPNYNLIDETEKPATKNTDTKSSKLITEKIILNEIQECKDNKAISNKLGTKIYSNMCDEGINKSIADFDESQFKSEDRNKSTPFSSFPTMENLPNNSAEHYSGIPNRTKNDSNIKKYSENIKMNNSSEISTETTSTPPRSPISPRPWYKRPISTGKESAIPFKREIILKTIEKRKSKPSDQSDSGLPEVSFSRSSIFDSTNKFNLFSRQRDIKNSKGTKENRLSSINMPNISELDREAAEILINESKSPNWIENKSYNPPDRLQLQQKMFAGTDTVTNKIENLITSTINDDNIGNENNTESSQSAKDLINKFETEAEKPKVTINLSYVAKTENFIGIPTSVKTETVIVEKETPIQKIDKDDLVKTKYIIQDKNTENEDLKQVSFNEERTGELPGICDKNMVKLTWSCSYCTLENPNWRIICEVCEHLKPFQNCSEEISKAHITEPEKFGSKKLIKSVPTSPQNSKISVQDWEWKAEIVKKYFQKQNDATSDENISSANSQNSQSTLCKFPNDFSVASSKPTGKEQIKGSVTKSEDPNKTLTHSQDDKILNKNKNHEVSSNDISSINLEQIRIARLAKFSILSPLNNEYCRSNENNDEKINFLNDPNSLEMEKQRLREKIRAMNAKALAEKYPIVKKSLSLDDPTVDSQISSQNRSKDSCKENQFPTSSEIETIQKANMEPNLLEKKENLNETQYINMNSSQGTKQLLNKQYIFNILQDTSTTKQIKTPISDTNNKNISNTTNVFNSSSKSGAIKKVLTSDASPLTSSDKNFKIQSKVSDNITNKLDSGIYAPKPNKVSSSCQTSSGLIKKSSEYDSKVNSSLNALVSPIKGHKFKNDELIFKNAINSEKNNQGTDMLYKKLSELDREQVKELSRKLTSVEGRNNFKININREHANGISHTDTLVLNKILRNLEQAISEGKHQLAARLAMDLAKMKVSLQVTKLKSKRSNSFDNDLNQNFIVDMFIEDRISQKGPIQISVNPLMTVIELKRKVLQDYNIPIELQNWIINEELLYNEELTLFECGVKNNLANLYLYILTPTKETKNQGIDYKFTIPKTSKASLEDDFNDQNSINLLNSLDNDFQKGAVALPFKESIGSAVSDDETPWPCPLCTLINNPMSLSCSACSKTKPLTKYEKSSISEELKKILKEDDNSSSKSKVKNLKSDSNHARCTTITITSSSNNNNNNISKSTTSMLNNNFNLNNKDSKDIVLLRPREQKNDLNKISPNRKSTEIYNIVEEVIKPVPINISETISNPIQEQHLQRAVNFSSPNITKNKYRGVDNFNPYRKDNDIILHHIEKILPNENINVKTNVRELNLKPSIATVTGSSSIVKDVKPDQKKDFILKSPYSTNHYLELLKLHHSDVVRNLESFECPICFENIENGSGIILRECLHTFCKECLINTIKFNEEAQVKCPYMDAIYSCNSFLQEREIKSLVTKEIFEKHLAKSVKLAEHRIENAFHCKTANCRGWCIYEDNVNEFLCPVCNLKNCLTCAAIHDGITCKQYQDGLNDCDNSENAKRTKEMFKEMVEKGEALNCPTCQVIMMKKWGCDWLKCSMCKTEVCWVTKGPRWGPAGKGDTSGGCKCGVNGVKCHPKCNYCH